MLLQKGIDVSDSLQHDLLNAKQACSPEAWPEKRLTCLRTYLDTTWNTIQSQHRSGASGTDVVAALPQRMDTLIQALYAEAAIEHGASSQAAILAQGGYGRGALNPCSDIDLLFLFRKKINEKDPLTRAILHTLWDLRF